MLMTDCMNFHNSLSEAKRGRERALGTVDQPALQAPQRPPPAPSACCDGVAAPSPGSLTPTMTNRRVGTLARRKFVVCSVVRAGF